MKLLRLKNLNGFLQGDYIFKEGMRSR